MTHRRKLEREVTELEHPCADRGRDRAGGVLQVREPNADATAPRVVTSAQKIGRFGHSGTDPHVRSCSAAR
jgi:hypothetical protein